MGECGTPGGRPPLPAARRWLPASLGGSISGRRSRAFSAGVPSDHHPSDVSAIDRSAIELCDVITNSSISELTSSDESSTNDLWE